MPWRECDTESQSDQISCAQKSGMKISKQLNILALVSIVVGLTIVFFKRWETTAVEYELSSGSRQASEIRGPKSPGNLENQGRQTVQSEQSENPQPAPTFNPLDFVGVTKDSAVMEFLASHRTKPSVGEVRSIGDSQELWLNGRKVFRAEKIDEWRSISDNGTIALVAKIPSLTGDVSASVDNGAHTIWTVDVNGKTRQISLDSMVARNPLISPDGKRVAFSAYDMNQPGPQVMQLFVTEMQTGALHGFSPNPNVHNYIVSPGEWLEDGKILAVIEDHGETGGNMTMKQIRLEP